MKQKLVSAYKIQCKHAKNYTFLLFDEHFGKKAGDPNQNQIHKNMHENICLNKGWFCIYCALFDGHEERCVVPFLSHHEQAKNNIFPELQQFLFHKGNKLFICLHPSLKYIFMLYRLVQNIFFLIFYFLLIRGSRYIFIWCSCRLLKFGK